jgi:hypothetical protein
MLVGCVLPVALLGTGSVALLWGPRSGILHGVFCALMGLVLVEMLLVNFCKVPFTCTYFPGTARIRVLWPAYLVGFTNYAYTSTSVETAIMLDRPIAFAVFCTVLHVAAATLAIVRARGLTRRTGLLFEATDPDALFAGFRLSEAHAASSPPPPLTVLSK